jgi:hypothetical protein
MPLVKMSVPAAFQKYLKDMLPDFRIAVDAGAFLQRTVELHCVKLLKEMHRMGCLEHVDHHRLGNGTSLSLKAQIT